MYGVNGSSDAISRDMNSILYSTTFKHPADGEFAKIKQLISLDPYPNFDNQNQNQNQDQNQSQQQLDDSRSGNQSSLLRYRSTPSSFFSNLLTDNGGDDFPDHVAGSSNQEPEERFFMRNQRQEQNESESDVREFLRYTPSSVDAKHERKVPAIRNQDPPATMNGSRRVPNLPPVNERGSYGYTNQNNLDSTSSNLVRQNSPPAGFLSSLTDGHGIASMKKGSSSSSMNNHISFSLGSSSSSSRFFPQIAENVNELQESPFLSMKRSRDGVLRTSQIEENGRNTPNLVHHMSLPKTSSEMAIVDNFLHFQQESTVPWKTRAKRGFATHPRSIAERERRTRISERIKRLQELFPDIDKQTNTADMLDMAVEYIKNLQKELQNLNDARARCTCSTTQLQSGSHM